jgi:hypothetical protein
MNLRLIVFYCILITSLIYAYDENNLADLIVPTQIAPKSLEVNIVHRFLRDPAGDFPDNFVTLANVNLHLRYVIWSKLEIGTGWLFLPKEYTFHAAYSYFMPNLYLRTQAYIQFYGTQTAFGDRTSWKNNALYQINLQSEPIVGRIFPTVNLLYDGLIKKFGLGTGLDVAVLKDLDIVGEYFPVIGGKDSVAFGGGPAMANCYSVGFKISTPGHHFMFSISNSTDMGVRRLMRGTYNNNIYFGFNIQRLISF